MFLSNSRNSSFVGSCLNNEQINDVIAISERDGETDRQTDIQTDSQTDRQTDRLTD